MTSPFAGLGMGCARVGALQVSPSKTTLASTSCVRFLEESISWVKSKPKAKPPCSGCPNFDKRTLLPCNWISQNRNLPPRQHGWLPFGVSSIPLKRASTILRHSQINKEHRTKKRGPKKQRPKNCGQTKNSGNHALKLLPCRKLKNQFSFGRRFHTN